MRGKIKFLVFLICLFAFWIILSISISSKIENNNTTKNYIVILKEVEKKPYLGITKTEFEERKTQIAAIQEKVLSQLDKHEFKLKFRYATFPGFAAELSSSAVEKLKKDPRVKAIYPEQTLYIFLQDSVPLINANDVWQVQINDTNLTGSSITVCVIDTGINYSHPDLGGCFGQNCKVIGGYDFINNDSDPMDDHGHGTHVAGIVAANGSIKGVAPDAKLAALKVCDAAGTCPLSAIIAGIDWCNNNTENYNITVITMSLGTGVYNQTTCPDWMDEPINDAVSLGIIVIAASGNDGATNGISYPACSPNVTSVGATSKTDVIADFTNRASILDLLAPGVNINSTSRTGGYTIMSGTSMATPHVAGLAALIYQNQKLQNSTTEPKTIRDIMKMTGVFIQDPSNLSRFFPRIDAITAVAAFHNLIVNHTENSVENPEGKIHFTNETDFSNILKCINISHNLISVDSIRCPEFNKSAQLVLRNLQFYDPTILRDNEECPSHICTKINYSDGNLLFNVSFFTNYSAKEGDHVCNCSNCEDCIAKINNASCAEVILTTNINSSSTCINNPENFSNKNFDCQSFTITGFGIGYGIYLENRINNTIKNCIITNFSRGIYLVNSSHNIFENNVITSNIGFYLDNSSSNIFENNTVMSELDFYSENNSYNVVKNLKLDNAKISFESKDVALKNDAAPAPDPSGYKNINKYINATNTSGDSWLFLNISYKDNEAQGIDESTLRIWKYNGSWYLINESNVDTSANWVYGNLTKFSIFAPLGQLSTRRGRGGGGGGYITAPTAPVPMPVCGNNKCEIDENYLNCPEDCLPLGAPRTISQDLGDIIEGKSFEGTTGDAFRFKVKGQEHVMQIGKISNDSVILFIWSSPARLLLRVGETKQLDLNNDSFAELQITLSKIEKDKAFLLLKEIEEIKPPMPEFPIHEEKKELKTEEQELFAILFIVVILLAFILFIVILAKSKKHNL